MANTSVTTNHRGNSMSVPESPGPGLFLTEMSKRNENHGMEQNQEGQVTNSALEDQSNQYVEESKSVDQCLLSADEKLDQVERQLSFKIHLLTSNEAKTKSEYNTVWTEHIAKNEYRFSCGDIRMNYLEHRACTLETLFLWLADQFNAIEARETEVETKLRGFESNLDDQFGPKVKEAVDAAYRKLAKDFPKQSELMNTLRELEKDNENHRKGRGYAVSPHSNPDGQERIVSREEKYIWNKVDKMKATHGSMLEVLVRKVEDVENFVYKNKGKTMKVKPVHDGDGAPYTDHRGWAPDKLESKTERLDAAWWADDSDEVSPWCKVLGRGKESSGARLGIEPEVRHGIQVEAKGRSLNERVNQMAKRKHAHQDAVGLDMKWTSWPDFADDEPWTNSMKTKNLQYNYVGSCLCRYRCFILLERKNKRDWHCAVCGEFFEGCDAIVEHCYSDDHLSALNVWDPRKSINDEQQSANARFVENLLSKLVMLPTPTSLMTWHEAIQHESKLESRI